jgi:hypothetical protein
MVLPIQGIMSWSEPESIPARLVAQLDSDDALIWGCQVEWLEEDVIPKGGVEAQCGVSGEVSLKGDGSPPLRP